MKPNLESLREEIPNYLTSHGFALFRGYNRQHDNAPIIEWDCERFPEYQPFIAVAAKLGVELIIFRDQEFQGVLVDSALEDLEDSEIPYDDRQDYERILREFRSYVGFTCAIEMTFDFDGAIYSFELKTEWYREFQRISNELSTIADEGIDDDDTSLGGYFSRN